MAELLKRLRVDGSQQEVALLQARVLHRRIQLMLCRCHAPARLQVLADTQHRHLVTVCTSQPGQD